MGVFSWKCLFKKRFQEFIWVSRAQKILKNEFNLDLHEIWHVGYRYTFYSIFNKIWKK